MYFKIGYSVCPNCKNKYAVYFDEILFSIKGKSGLGPEIVRCTACNAVFPSGLIEWEHMTAKQKRHYWFISMPYAFGMGVALSMFTWNLLAYLVGSDYAFLGVAVIFACFVLLFQLFRIFLSYRRTEEAIPEPFPVSFKIWQTNFQFYCFIIALFCEFVFLVGM